MNNEQNNQFNQLPLEEQKEVVNIIVEHSNGDRAYARNIAKGSMSDQEFASYLNFVQRRFGQKGRIKVIKTLSKCFTNGKAYGRYSVRVKSEEEIAKERRAIREAEKIRQKNMSDKEKRLQQAKRIKALERQEARERRELSMLSPQERNNILAKRGAYQMSDIEFSRLAQNNKDKRFSFKY